MDSLSLARIPRVKQLSQMSDKIVSELKSVSEKRIFSGGCASLMNSPGDMCTKMNLIPSVEQPSMSELCENENDKDNLEQGLSLDGVVNSEI